MGKISLSNMNNVGSYSNNKSTSNNNNYNYYNNDIYKNVDVSVEKSKKVYCGISGYISSEYNPTLIEIVKSAPERFWHSDRKCWEVAYTYLNDVLDKLKNNGFNISIDYKTNVDDINNINVNNDNIEIPKDYKFVTKPYGQFQLDGIKYGLNVNKFLLLDEQGCISGECFVRITNDKCNTSLKMKLRNLYKHFYTINDKFYKNVKIKSLVDGRFRMYNVEDVIYKGVKDTIRITANNYVIECTPDHEFYTPLGWKRADTLNVNDIVFTNGKQVCPECGGTDDIITNPYAKYTGYCRTCMYKYKRDGTKYKGNTINRKVNSDGYSEHCKIHSDTKSLHLPQFNPNITEIKKGNKVVYMIPQETKITKIEHCGEQDVYDIKLDCNEGIHNFICNNFIVHNCGKTYQSANIACIRKKFKNFKHCLVICCVNSNKYNWVEEVETHTKEKGYILGTRYRKTTGKKYMGSSADKLDDLKHLNDCFFQILNVEALIYSVTKDKILKNGKIKKIKEYPIVEQIKKLISDNDIGYIIVDEIHKIKDSTSQRGKALLDLDCDCVGMTGTPLMNSPVDLYSPLKFIGAENHSLTQFKSHYCVFGGFGGHQIVSYKNLGELQNLLDKHSIRRLRKDELDLPPKIEITKYVELAKDQQAIYDEIKEETIDAIKNIDKVKMNFTPLTMFTRMRQCTGNPSILTTKNISNAKFDMLLELANELRANNEKFLVYSNWTSVLNDAYKLLMDNGFNPAIYTGQNTKEREGEKTKFKTNKNCLCLCGTIDAMGTGLTLTEATTVIFLDEPWTKANKSQAEDRAYRIGTKSSVNIITIIAKDTIDERIHNMVHKKGKMSDIIVDKEVDATANEKMVNYLLS